MVSLIHLILILEKNVLSLILDFESEIALAGRYATIPIIQRLLGFIGKVAPRANRDCIVFR